MQTWTNLLNYFKRNLGTKLNLLEMDDDEIMEGIKDDVIPLFSQYSPNKKYCIINSANLLPFVNGSGDTQFKYQIPATPEEYIIDIYDVYVNRGSGSDIFYDTKYAGSNVGGSLTNLGRGSTDTYGGGMIDTVIDNEFLNALNSLSKKTTWEFTAPNILRIDLEIHSAVVVYKTIHTSLNTIDPDMYNIVFKPLCLGHIMLWVASLRSKYESITTPMGEVRVNYQKLEQDGNTLIAEAKEKLENILPDCFLEIV